MIWDVESCYLDLNWIVFTRRTRGSRWIELLVRRLKIRVDRARAMYALIRYCGRFPALCMDSLPWRRRHRKVGFRRVRLRRKPSGAWCLPILVPAHSPTVPNNRRIQSDIPGRIADPCLPRIHKTTDDRGQLHTGEQMVHPGSICSDIFLWPRVHS
jgi:hypothetical protein